MRNQVVRSQKYIVRKRSAYRALAAGVLLAALSLPSFTRATIVSFDDLADETMLSGTSYAGLTWESGNEGYGGNEGSWLVLSDEYPYSSPNNVINTWGCTLIGIAFPTNVNVSGAYFTAQGLEEVWTSGVRVHGYRSGLEVATTDWFSDIDTHPDWFAMNLGNVDRIVIESVPVIDGGGWYGMDDLTYSIIPEPAALGLLGLVSAGIYFKRRFFIA